MNSSSIKYCFLSISLLSFSLFSLHSNFRCTDRYARVRDCCNDCKRINKQIPKIARQSFVGSRRSEFPPNSFPGVFEMKLQKSNYSCSPYGVRAELLQFDSPEITGNRVERDLRWKTSGLLKCNRTRERGNEVIVFSRGRYAAEYYIRFFDYEYPSRSTNSFPIIYQQFIYEASSLEMK